MRDRNIYLLFLIRHLHFKSMKIRNQWFFILFLLFGSFFRGYTQNYQLQGEVLDLQNKKIPFFSAIILNPVDSDLVVGGNFTDGCFDFSNLKAKKGILKIQSIGYQTVYRNIDFSIQANLNLGSLKMDSLSIGEVVIKARRPVFHQEHGNILVTIKGTTLSQSGTLTDALKRCPGIKIDSENNLSVIGKGSPIIYLDDHEVQDQSELDNLQSDDILSIEIDRNPSAQYSAEGNAVVRIKTRTLTSDQVNMQWYNRLRVGRKTGNESGIKLNSHQGKTSFFGSYSYDYDPRKVYEKAYERNFQTDYTIYNHSTSTRTNTDHNHRAFVSLAHDFSSRSSLGAQYSLYHYNGIGNTYEKQFIEKTGTATLPKRVETPIDYSHQSQTFNVNYHFSPDSTKKLLLVADYSPVKRHSKEDILETNLNAGSVLRTLVQSSNQYQVYTLNADYQTPFFQWFQLRSGVKWSKIDNSGQSASVNRDTGEQNYLILNHINDQIGAGYLLARKSLGRYDLEAGIRIEHTQSIIHSEIKTVLDSTYTNWFPSVSVSYAFSDESNFSLEYSRKIDRPGFDELSPEVTYFDSLSYCVGNPSVRPTLSDNFDLMWTLPHGFDFDLTYQYSLYNRELAALQDDTNPDIVKYMPVNLSHASELDLSITYSYDGKRFSSVNTIMGTRPFTRIPFRDSYRKIRQFSIWADSYNDLVINDHLNVYTELTYQSKQQYDMTKENSSFDLEAGFFLNCWKKRLQLSVDVENILNTNDASWEDRYGTIISGGKTNRDNRMIRFTLKFNWHHFSGETENQSASQDELDRL